MAIDSLPIYSKMSVEIIVSFETIYEGELILTLFSNIGEDVLYNTVVSVKCLMLEVFHSPTLCHYSETIIDFK